MSAKINIVDYGFGNLHSIVKALKFIGAKQEITDRPEALSDCDGLIIPGVGAFGEAMAGLRKRGFIEPLYEYVKSNKPVLGICLGMQFLLSLSEEFGSHKGLDIIPGKVVYFPQKQANDNMNYKIPHIGWNSLGKCGLEINWKDTILSQVSEGEEVYFVHSYVVSPESRDAILAFTEYGGNNIPAVIRKDNVYGCQFHPEKSRDTGLRILKAFTGIVESHK